MNFPYFYRVFDTAQEATTVRSVFCQMVASGKQIIVLDENVGSVCDDVSFCGRIFVEKSLIIGRLNMP